MNIKNQIISILNEIDKRAELIAVSKTRNFNEIKEAYDSGQKSFGENRVQELVDKYEKLPKDIEWHMIGHLQRNKVKYIAPFIELIHSVDSLKLMLEINKQGEKNKRTIKCLLQIKIANEENKFGLFKDEVENLISLSNNLNYIKIIGLMGMATYTNNDKIIDREFKEIYNLFKILKISYKQLSILSIGMSNDYLIAINNGSNMVRIGSQIFGERN